MRYLPLTPDDRKAMLAKIGAPTVDALFRDVPREAAVPLSVFDLPDTQGELEDVRQGSVAVIKAVVERPPHHLTLERHRPCAIGLPVAYRHRRIV